MVKYQDSLDKIVSSYFSAVTSVKFLYKGREYSPKPLRISNLILRTLRCPTYCGGCCPRFSLEMLPSEISLAPTKLAQSLKPREVEFDGRKFELLSDLQQENTSHFCKHLDMKNGWCTVHEYNPMTCDFEILRFFHSEESVKLNTQKFGRGWQFLRVDGEKGAKCEISDSDKVKAKSEVLRKLNRLKQWTDYFKLKTKLPDIIDHLKTDRELPYVFE